MADNKTIAIKVELKGTEAQKKKLAALETEVKKLTNQRCDKAKPLLSVFAIYRHRKFNISIIHADNGFSQLEFQGLKGCSPMYIILLNTFLVSNTYICIFNIVIDGSIISFPSKLF